MANTFEHTYFSSPVVAGDTLVALIGMEFGTSNLATSVTDNLGNNWVQVPGVASSPNDATAATDIWMVASAAAASANALQITVNWSGTAGQAGVVVYDLAGQGTVVATATQSPSDNNLHTLSLNVGASQAVLLAINNSFLSGWNLDATAQSDDVMDLSSTGNNSFSAAGGTSAVAFAAASGGGGGGTLLTNLTGQAVGTVLTTAQFNPVLDKGASCDMTVRQGTIYGLESPSGHGTGLIAPIGVNLALRAGQQNIVRAGEADKVAPPYVNGQTVLFVRVVTSAGDLTAKLVT